MELESKLARAPELYGNAWINSSPVSVRESEGSVILIDFWDYARDESVRSLQLTMEWHKRYSELGLITVGVHTPEFKFGRDIEHLDLAVRRLGIVYPVVADNDEIIASAYGNRSLPGRLLVDKNGYIRYRQSGGGNQEQFERAIQHLVREAGYRGDLPSLIDLSRKTTQVEINRYRGTKEIQFGYLRSMIGNPEGYNPESTVDYKDPGIHLFDRFYLDGKWTNEREFVRFDGSSAGEGRVFLLYESWDVNAVLGPQGPAPCTVTVRQDGKPVRAELAGTDLTVTGKESSFVVVDSPRLYHLVRNRGFESHELTLSVNAPLEVYVMTFGADGETHILSSN